MATALERLVDGLGAGGQAALQGSEGKADGTLASAVDKLVGLGELRFDIFGDGRIERRFGIGELIIDGVGATFWKKRRAVELEQVFLDHAAHEIRNVDLVRTVTELAVKAIGVQQREKELKILFLTIVRGGSHQQKVAGDAAEQFSQLKTLGLADLVAKVAGGELVSLIDDHEVPMGVAQFFEKVF